MTGKRHRLNSLPVTIVGVTEPRFQGAVGSLSFDLFLPVGLQARLSLGSSLNDRASRWLYAIGRLQPGVGAREAHAVAQTVSQRLASTYPESNRHASLIVRPLWQAPYGGQDFFMPVVRILAAVTSLVLLLILANLVSLQLAKATTRGQELAVRQALGADRRRIVCQLLTESVVLALLGGSAGVALAIWGVSALRIIPIHSNLPVLLDLRLDTGSLLFAFVLALVCGILFGLTPALKASGNCEQTLRAEGRTVGATAVSHRLRSALIVAEVGLATLVLIGAGLCLRSYWEAQLVDRGFKPDQVIVAPLVTIDSGHSEDDRRGLHQRLLDDLGSLHGVESVSLADEVPLGPEGLSGVTIAVEGYQPQPGEDLTFDRMTVAPRYLETLRIPLVAGREFTEADSTGTADVVIVSLALARRFWPDQSAVGRRVMAWGRSFRIVGVAQDWKTRHLEEAPQPLLLFNYLQVSRGARAPVLYVRGREDQSRLIGALGKRVRAVDPSVYVHDAMPMTRYIDLAVAPQRITAALMFLVGFMALLLASMGIFSVLAYVVRLRMNEYGVRIALGATSSRLLALVLGQWMRPVLIGIAIGLVLSMSLAHMLSGFLIDVHPTNPTVFGIVAALIALVGAAACYLPARQALRASPMTSLRKE